MKHLYAFTGIALLCASIPAAMSAEGRQRAMSSFPDGARVYSSIALGSIPPVKAADGSRADDAGNEPAMVITDFETQVKGRYSCEYYSPLVDPVTGEPFGNCIEQPMIVEDYFAEKDGDVNIGYLFMLNGILKGHVDFSAGTITIPSKFVSMYYEDPDDYDDPGLEVHFVTVDIQDNKFVPNYERPFVGTFQLHDGKITRIVTDDMWGYVAVDENGQDVGWFEVARNSVFYLGHGEMEYLAGDLDGDGKDDVEQTVVYAESNGTVAKVYNAFRCGWNTPIEIEIDGGAASAVINGQSVAFAGKDAMLTDGASADVITGIIRDVDWDTDKRDPAENAVVEFPAVSLRDKESGDDLASFSAVKFYFKDDVTADNSGIGKVDADLESVTAPVEYYTLTGVKVPADNLLPGIYIMRRGACSEKIVIR